MKVDYDLVCPDCRLPSSRITLEDAESDGDVEDQRILRCPRCKRYYSRVELLLLKPEAAGFIHTMRLLSKVE